MSLNIVVLTVGAALAFGLYGLRLSTGADGAAKKRAWLTALLALALSAVLGLVLARVSYALLMQELDFEYDGLEALEQLLWVRIDNMSFFGGAAGVCLGAALAQRLLNKGGVLAGLDAFAPSIALLVALFRVNEGFFGSYGAGASVPEGSLFRSFPFALWVEVDGNYGYYAWAICLLSALFAIAWAVTALALERRQGQRRRGLLFTLTLFFLALPQVLCESMRKRGMFWLFVHVEQLLCAVLLFGVLLYWIIAARDGLPIVKKWAPAAVVAACSGLLAATEFAIDGKLFDFSPAACYVFMTALLIVIGAAGVTAVKRWQRSR